MNAPATSAPAPKPRVTAHDRALRQRRILARMQEGWSYDAVAQDERLSRERIRQIVAETPALRDDPVRDHKRSQIAKLDPALRLAAGKVAEGDLRAIDRLLKGLDRLDKYQRASAARAKAEGLKTSGERLDRAFEAHNRAEGAKRAAQGRGDRGGRQWPAIAPSGRPENPDSKLFRL
jgi:hypothetical protein